MIINSIKLNVENVQCRRLWDAIIFQNLFTTDNEENGAVYYITVEFINSHSIFLLHFFFGYFDFQRGERERWKARVIEIIKLQLIAMRSRSVCNFLINFILAEEQIIIPCLWLLCIYAEYPQGMGTKLLGLLKISNNFIHIFSNYRKKREEEMTRSRTIDLNSPNCKYGGVRRTWPKLASSSRIYYFYVARR